MTAQQKASRNIRELYVTDGERTFQFDAQLPSLPVPRLRDTLTRYLQSVRHLVGEGDWQRTKSLVQQFEQGAGARLQAYLESKASKEKNWLDQWWLEYAYLRSRTSLIPFSNMSAAMPVQPFWPDTTQSTEIAYRAALVLRFTIDFYLLLRDERMRPMLHKDHYWSMDQFRRLFNTCRVPQPEVDRLETYFRTRFESEQLPSQDVIVFHNGHIFRIAMFENNDNSSSSRPVTGHTAGTVPDQFQTPCSIRKLYEQLKTVLEHPKCCESKGPAVGALTAGTRDRWAKNRIRLLELSDRNRMHLDQIERSLLCISFEPSRPQTANERLQWTMCGPADDRWADKSVCNVFYGNGAAGAICDHTPFDGFASALLTHYVLTCLNECAGQWPESASIEDPLELPPQVCPIDFDLDEVLRNEIELARAQHRRNCDRIRVLCKSFDGYGKKFLKPLRLHPEAVIQVALQVAYERVRQQRPDLHTSPATCYCTASTRQFYNGRTETVRSCTAESAELSRLMLNNREFNASHLKALQQATNKFQQLMSEAMAGQGVDRHFLGLYLASIELGEELPDFFTDPTFSVSGSGGNYLLSTSCAGYWNITGGVPPMREDGYGVFYGIEDDALHFSVIEYSDNLNTDGSLFFETICDTLIDFERITQKAKL